MHSERGRKKKEELKYYFCSITLVCPPLFTLPQDIIKYIFKFPVNQRIKNSHTISPLMPVTFHKSCISVLRKLLTFWGFLGGWIYCHEAFKTPWLIFFNVTCARATRVFTDLLMTIVHFLLAELQVLAAPPWTRCCLTGSCLFLSPSPLLGQTKG